jgi:hypothetical protein
MAASQITSGIDHRSHDDILSPRGSGQRQQSRGRKASQLARRRRAAARQKNPLPCGKHSDRTVCARRIFGRIVCRIAHILTASRDALGGRASQEARMRIGVPQEIKANENRVGLVPACVRELTGRGHEVVVETGAGSGAGLPDKQYVAAGATILPDVAAALAGAELIAKVKEPQPVECAMLRQGHAADTFLAQAA